MAQNAAPTEKNATPLEATKKVITAGNLCSAVSTMTLKELTMVGSNAKPLAASKSSLGV